MTTATRPSISRASTHRGSAAAAFLRRDFSIIRSYRFPFVLDTFFGVLQLAVYYFISRTFKETPSQQLNGAPSYFAFAAVGIVIALVIEAAAEGVAQRVREEQLSGSLEALMAQPLSAAGLCAGFTAFPFVFALARSTVYLAIAALAMKLDLGHADWVGFGLVFFTSATALVSLGILAGAAVLVFKRGQLLSGGLIFAMTLISGSVFPVTALPDWLAQIGSVLPLRFAFDGARDALFRGSGWGPDVLGLAGFTVIGLPIAVWVFGRALQAVRRAGSLGQY
ncbi:MAG: ABC transporter permease [Chloroflexota bacterium]|nr:ABC transporter permease [Chloroflexota bacterium]